MKKFSEYAKSKSIFYGVYFDCTEIKSELLRKTGVTPQRLTAFLKNASEYSYEMFEWANYEQLNHWEDAEGISAGICEILDLINYNNWSEDEQENSDLWESVLDALKKEVEDCIISDRVVKVDWLDDGSEGDQFFVIAKDFVEDDEEDDEEDDDEEEYEVRAIVKASEDTDGCAEYTCECIYTSNDPDDARKFADNFGKGKYYGRHDSYNTPYDHGYNEVLIEVYNGEGYVGDQQFISMKDYKELMKA